MWPASMLEPSLSSDNTFQQRINSTYFRMSTEGDVDKGVRILSLGMHFVSLKIPATALTVPIKMVEVLEPTLNY